MHTRTINIELKMYELDILKEILDERIIASRDALNKSEQGEDLFDKCDSELDVEYNIENYERLSGLVSLTQRKNNRNCVEFIDQQELYRPEQMVELFRVRGCGIDQIFYVFTTRHGVKLVYENLCTLISSFAKNKESKLRFECSREVEHFLSYWNPLNNGKANQANSI